MKQEKINPDQSDLSERALYLSNYSRYVYDHSIDRFGRIDQKASSILSANLLVVGIVLSLGNWWIYTKLGTGEEIFFSIFSWILLVSIISAAATAIRFSIITLKVHYVAVPPLNKEVFDYVYNNSLLDIRYGVSNTIHEANTEVSEKIARKVEGRRLPDGAHWEEPRLL